MQYLAFLMEKTGQVEYKKKHQSLEVKGWGTNTGVPHSLEKSQTLSWYLSCGTDINTQHEGYLLVVTGGQ